MSEQSIDKAERAAAIKARRMALGIRSISAAAGESKRLGFGIDRSSFTAAERGTASDAVYARIDAFYDRYESSPSGSTTVEVTTNDGHVARFVGSATDVADAAARFVRTQREEWTP